MKIKSFFNFGIYFQKISGPSSSGPCNLFRNETANQQRNSERATQSRTSTAAATGQSRLHYSFAVVLFDRCCVVCSLLRCVLLRCVVRSQLYCSIVVTFVRVEGLAFKFQHPRFLMRTACHLSPNG